MVDVAGFRMVELEDFSPEKGISPGKGGEAVDPLAHLAGRLVEVEPANRFAQFGGAADQRLILSGYFHPIFGDGVEGLHQQFAAGRRQTVVQGAGGIVRVDRHLPLEDDVPGVDLFAQEDGGDAGKIFSADDGPVNRRCATVFRQQ